MYFKVEGGRQLDLDLVHCIDITRLDKVLKLFNLLAQLLNGNLVILNGAHDLIVIRYYQKQSKRIHFKEQMVAIEAVWKIQ